MKSAVILSLFFVLPTWAEGFCTIGEQIYPIGETAKFYYVAESAAIGPNYSCDELSRTRICQITGTGARWSEEQPQCQTWDSGGCTDRWLDQLPDAAFGHAECR